MEFDLIDAVLILIVGIIIGACLMNYTHSLQSYDFTGAYLQAAKNCIASHDWNSTWCTTGIMK